MGYYLQIWRCFFIFTIVSLTVLVPFFKLLRLDYQTGNGKGAHILAANTNETTFSLKLKTGHYLDPHQLTKIWLKCHVPVLAKICNQKLQLAVHSVGKKSCLCFLEMNHGLHIRKEIQQKIHKITGWWNETEWLLKINKNCLLSYSLWGRAVRLSHCHSHSCLLGPARNIAVFS